MKTIALVAKRGKAEALELARQIRERCSSLSVLADRQLASELGWEAPENDRLLAERADVMIVLGGDGTLIHGARLLLGREIPILGVNLGSLGFMTEIPQQDLFPMLERIKAGQYRVEKRMKLTCRLFRGQELVVEDEVLNDVVINKGALARIADHETFIDDEYVATYKSDGMIISTPTGSTAYSLSAGGPIVHPSLEGMLVTPICSHSLTQRPLVVPADRVIRVTLKSEVADVYLTLDGQAGRSLQTNDVIEVRRSPNPVLLIRNPAIGYFAVLRQKLHWGER